MQQNTVISCVDGEIKNIEISNTLTNAYKINLNKGGSFIVGENDKLILKLIGVETISLNEKYNRYRVRYFYNTNIVEKTLGKKKTVKESKRECKEHLEKVKKEPGYQKGGDIIEITVGQYLKLKNRIKNLLRLFSQEICFNGDYDDETDPDPYLLGVWLGDGTSDCTSITNIDKPIIDYMKKYCEKNNMHLNKVKSARYRYYLCGNGKKGGNLFLNGLKKYNLLNNKHIPEKFLFSRRDIRIEILAGLIDTDGTYETDKHGNGKNNFVIFQKSDKLSKNIVFLARSLGFKVSIKAVYKNCHRLDGIKIEGIYNRINISGEKICEIPTLLNRKNASPAQKNIDFLKYKFTIDSLGQQEIDKIEFDDYCVDENVIVRSTGKRDHTIIDEKAFEIPKKKLDIVTLTEEEINELMKISAVTNNMVYCPNNKTNGLCKGKIKTVTENAFVIKQNNGNSFILGETDKLVVKMIGHESLTLIDGKGYNFQYIENLCTKDKLFVASTEEESKELVDKFKETLYENEGYQKAGTIVEINVYDYFTLSETVRGILRTFKADIEFPKIDVVLDPYIMGLWLGKGCNDGDGISLTNEAVINYLKLFAQKNKLQIKAFCANKFAIRSSKNNVFLDTLKKYNLINNKHIPDEYLYNDKNNRMKLLAGIIDSKGSLRKDKRSFMVTPREVNMVKYILLLIDTLGFNGNYIKEGGSNKIIISGSLVETIPIRNQTLQPKESTKDIIRKVSKFTLIPIGIQTFDKLELENNDRYLLPDSTVRSCLQKENNVLSKRVNKSKVIDI